MEDNKKYYIASTKTDKYGKLYIVGYKEVTREQWQKYDENIKKEEG